MITVYTRILAECKTHTKKMKSWDRLIRALQPETPFLFHRKITWRTQIRPYYYRLFCMDK